MQEEEQQSLRRKSRGHEGHSEGTDHLVWLSVCDFKDNYITRVLFLFYLSFCKVAKGKLSQTMKVCFVFYCCCF